nr:ribosome-inactivating protein [Tanacetum cinerariifolium]
MLKIMLFENYTYGVFYLLSSNIINTENVYVVGYLFRAASRPTLYYLDDIPREELLQAFPSRQYNFSPLGFAGNYRSLPDREKTELGHGALNDAIRNLYYRHSQPSALLVIIQMVSKATRIRARSMENRWSDLSEQIQWLGESKVFLTTILVRSVLNEVVSIRSVVGVMRQAALALMFYRCNPKAIRVPVPVAVRADEQCLDGEPANGYASGDYIWIFDCDKAEPEATKWVLYNVVIAAKSSTQRTVLNVADDNNSSRQAWSANTQPTINYISGFREMCLQANSAYACVWLANCVIGTKPRQHWALYGDSNIRLYSDRTLCVTSNGRECSDSIFLLKGQGSGDERWTFMADDTILNPNARLVMDVRNGDVSLKQIILYKPTGNPNQNWLAF